MNSKKVIMVSFVFNPRDIDDVIGFMNNRGYKQSVGSGAIAGTYCFYDGFFMDVYLHDNDDIEELTEDIIPYASCDF